MRKEIETYELIEQYLSGILSEPDVSEVENLIATDDKFAFEVEQHKKINDLIFNRSMIDVKEQISKIHAENITSKHNKFGGKKFFGFLGALVFIGTTIMLTTSNKKELSNDPIDNNTESKIDIIEENNHESKETENKSVVRDSKIQTKIQPVETKTNSIKPDLYRNAEPTPVHQEPESTIQDDNSSNTIEPFNNTKPIKDNKIVEVIPTKAEPPLIDQFDCSDVIISADIEITESCYNKPSGKILIHESSISGGKPPYEISIDGGLNYYAKFHFNKLYSRLYPIVIRDKNNCTSRKEDHILGSIECSSYEYAFAPEKGETWKIPTNNGIGKIVVYSKSGQVVFQQAFDYPDEYLWNGRNSAGNALPMGAYMFVLELEGEESFPGTVTIVR